jgi:hypothetical protein
MAGIRPVTLDDVMGLARYEAEREQIRRRIIALKRDRRVALGDEISLVFENHDTVSFQIHEMLRAEQITEIDGIRRELEVYNGLLPSPGELSATLFIEITDQARIEERLCGLLGIDEALRLEIGSNCAIPAQFDPAQSREDRLSAVQYIRFALPEEARRAFADPAVPVRLVADHPNYRAVTPLEGPLRASLTEDLRGT